MCRVAADKEIPLLNSSACIGKPSPGLEMKDMGKAVLDDPSWLPIIRLEWILQSEIKVQGRR